MKIILMIGTLTVAGLAFAANAQEVEDNDMSRTPAAITAPEGAGMARLYPGARDEQKLEVQTSLPAPMRSADGTAAPVSDDDDGPPATAPASD